MSQRSSDSNDSDDERLRPSSSQFAEGLRILLVEDDADSAFVQAKLLRHFGHNVQVVGNGVDALEAARLNHPEVIILDIGLPLMDGYQVASELMSHRTANYPLIIAVTGYGRESDRRRSVDVGIDVHLVKPVSQSALRQLLTDYQQSIRTARAET